MDSIEEHLDVILSGRPTPDDVTALVDFSLVDQIEELAAKGVESSLGADYRPVVKKSVSYIVAVVLLNDNGEVLMMQEAKSSCAGTWYLPAGRIEPGEQILAAAIREVEEETGLEFEPSTLLMLETAQGHWHRFVFTGKVTGGSLKTVASADSESLQASWIKDLNQLSLRANDILPLIEKARSYQEGEEPWHQPLLPCNKAHNKLLLKLVIIIRKKTNNRIHTLVCEKGGAHLPTCEINPTRSVHSTMKKYMQHIFESEPPQHKPHGVLTLEHNADLEVGRNDGICLTLLVSCRAALEEISLRENYTWLEVSSNMGNALLARTSKNMTVALHVIR